jgi:hypothetical protein
VPTTIQVTTSLPNYVPRHSDHQPKDHPRGSSPIGDPLGKPPFNPHVGSFGWSIPDPCMFIPPWHQPFVVQHVSKLATKLPYKKLQYPTYVKDTNPNAHIKVFQKAIKVNGKTMEIDIINMFGFILKDSMSKWNENYIQHCPNCIFE